MSQEFESTAVELIGGKAAGLGVLVAASVPVPAGFCLTTAAYQAAHTRPGEVDHEIRAAVAGLRALGARSFAVRSSHVSEDRAGTGSPGVYHSMVGLAGDEEILAAVRQAWASAGTPAADDYRQRRGVDHRSPSMAVLVQAAPTAAAGGVIYTILPGDGDPSALLIEYAAGPPVNVIDNLAPPHRCVISKRHPGTARPDPALLTTEQLQTLVSWSLAAERCIDAPLDLEWLLDPGGRLWMLQARRLPYPAVDPSGPYTAEAAGTTLRSDKLAVAGHAVVA
ncbi:MAG TPA: PEP/pyruvate-binding domain-containing protein [Micromonosporaceae bacterium]|nr:PEP/pyruvate-binding domain-containing protein [Micromonosporaceae bacterium]